LHSNPKEEARVKYDFDTVHNRRNTGSVKWDFADSFLKAKDVLPMWVADMDFQSPPPVIAALKTVAGHGIFGYTHATGSYYTAVIDWMEKRHHWTIRRDWIAITTGVVPALRLLIKAYTRPGDQVLIQTPVYYPFFDVIKDNGCEILDSPLKLQGNQYVMDFADLERKINPKTKIMLLCNPQNPVGRVWTAAELTRLGEICLRHSLLVISDEIHSDLVYKGFRHVPFTTLSPDFAERSIVCTAASKTFNLPGLATSNIVIADRGLRERFMSEMKICGMATPNMFGLAATEVAYRHGGPWLEQLLAYLQGNIDFIQEYAREKIPALKMAQPQGTYLLWLDLRDCGIPAARLGTFVREEAKVGLEAGTLFGCKENGLERMNIACPRTVIAEAMQRIEAAVRKARTAT
jgi:cysteine-S-conjugate beta-lyase